MTLTKFEKQILAIINALDPKTTPWVEVDKWGAQIGRTGNAVKGALGSLVRKGAIWIDYDGDDTFARANPTLKAVAR